MAIITSNPWQGAAEYGQGLGDHLSQIMFQLPAMRQQQLLSQAHQHLLEHQSLLADAEARSHGAQAGAYTAQAGLYGAEQKKTEAQTGEVTTTEAGKAGLSAAYKGFADAYQNGEDTKPFVSAIVENFAKLPHNDRAQLGEQLAQVLNMSKPGFNQQLGLGQHGIVPVASQGGLYDTVAGKMVAQEPQKLGYGQGLYDPSTGASLAQGRDRPLADTLHSAATGAYGRAYFDAYSPTSQKRILDSAPAFFQSLPGAGMPSVAPPIVPGRKIKRYNPDTGGLE